ncbi:hypothetical protein EG329_008453 [Mollisiaceae sp. DMI_Dod_QoI]|nr:hypothetical protein EG329_008453 [Helotiales sp. DMI_Dod_QoI]
MSSLLPKSTLGKFTIWEKQHINEVKRLLDQQVLRELQDIMRGRNYSWQRISARLQKRVDRGTLIVKHLELGNIPYKWDVLCDKKISWERNGRPSFINYSFNRACLINLKIIPTQAGLGPKDRGLATMNLDYWGGFHATLAIDTKDRSAGQEFRADPGDKGRYYADGPEFRIEYIHDRVED